MTGFVKDSLSQCIKVEMETDQDGEIGGEKDWRYRERLGENQCEGYKDGKQFARCFPFCIITNRSFFNDYRFICRKICAIKRSLKICVKKFQIAHLVTHSKSKLIILGVVFS